MIDMNINIQLLKQQVLGIFEQFITRPKVDQLIDTWFQKKQSFLKKFNGPIYEYPHPIVVTLPDEKKEEIYSEFRDTIKDPDISRFFYQVSTEEFFENRFAADTDLIIKPIYFDDLTSKEQKNGFDIYTIPVNKGAKVLKALSLFAKNFDTTKMHKTIREYQDLASIYIQKQKMTGTLCFSVHPLDFLSISENAENWRSCHALNGDYRSGNLEYMTNESTFVAYIKADEDKILPRFPDWLPWNSKKWRTLMFLSNDDSILFAGRSYPFDNPELLDIVKNVFCDLFRYISTPWTDQSIKTFTFNDDTITNLTLRYYYIGHRLKDLYELCGMTNIRTYLAYNDLIFSHSYIPKYCYLSPRGFLDDRAAISNWNDVRWLDLTSRATMIDMHPPVKCLHCGKNDITTGESFVCDDCLEEGYGSLASDERAAQEAEEEEENIEEEVFF